MYHQVLFIGNDTTLVSHQCPAIGELKGYHYIAKAQPVKKHP